MKKVLKVVAVLEAVSFLLLLVATIVKRTGGTEVGVEVLGPAHGGLFVVYCVLVLKVAVDERWRIGRTLLALLCSVLPFGGFVAERKLLDQDGDAAIRA